MAYIFTYIRVYFHISRIFYKKIKVTIKDNIEQKRIAL